MLQGQEWKLFDDDQLISVTAVREGGKTEADILDLSGQIPSGKIVFPVPEGKWQLKFCILTRNRGPHRDYINMMDEESCRVLIDTVYEPDVYKRQIPFSLRSEAVSLVFWREKKSSLM